MCTYLLNTLPISIAIDDCLTSAILYFSTLYISPYMYNIFTNYAVPINYSSAQGNSINPAPPQHVSSSTTTQLPTTKTIAITC